VSIVLDTGALIAADRGDRFIRAALESAEQDGTPLVTSAGALAQVWRDGARQARLARLRAGVSVRPLDEATARQIGELLAASGTADVVDAHVALLVEPEGRVITSDEKDLRALLRSRQVTATVVPV
jgi:hypothetical protein